MAAIPAHHLRVSLCRAIAYSIYQEPKSELETDDMKSRPPRSFSALLWDALRVSVRMLWQSSVNPARPLMERQQALALLGLPLNATRQQIKQRYRILAKRYHPDRGGDQRQMQRIIAAYTVLMKDTAR